MKAPTRSRRAATIRRAARAAAELRHRREGHPLERIAWLPPQLALLQHEGLRVLLRAGNQSVGKTTAALAEAIYRCEGGHPFKEVPPPPVHFWCVCAAWEQSVAIQGKAWALVTPSRLSPAQRPFDEANGFGSHSPMIRWANGSTLRFKTTHQRALNLAGATIDGAIFDEPPKNQRTYEEVKKRVTSRGGPLILSLTPINAPVEWLRDEVVAGRVVDLHYRLEAANLIPVGQVEPMIGPDGVARDQAWIDALLADTPEVERDVTCHGEWESAVEGQYFSAFIADPAVSDSHVIRRIPPTVELQGCVGVDHGTGRGNQAGVLVGVDDRQSSTGYPTIYVAEEYFNTTITTSEQDGDAVLAMLERRGWSYDELRWVYGDIPAGHGAGRKGNLDLADALARRLRLRSRDDLEPRIHTSKRGKGQGSGAGSMRYGLKWIHQRMVAGELLIDARCVRLIEALQKFDGTKDSPHKHIIDALHYALTAYIRRGPRTRAQPVRLLTR